MNIKNKIIEFWRDGRKKVRGDMSRALVRTFAARGFSAVGSLAFVMVLGHLYGSAGVGIYALAMSLVEGAATISRFGMNGAVMRFVGRDLSSPSVPAYLRLITTRSILSSTAFACIIFFTRLLWSELFGSPQLAHMLVWFAIATPAFTVAYVLAGFMKAVRKPATACLLQNGIISIFAATIIFGEFLITGAAKIEMIGVSYAIAAWLVLLLGSWQCLSWFRVVYVPDPTQDTGPLEIRAFRVSSSSFFVSDLTKLVTRVVSIWVAGIFLPITQVGWFKAANQVAILVRFILTVINAIFPPRFAELWHQGRRRALEALARKGVYLGIVFAIVPCALCIFFPDWVLAKLGKDFNGAGALLPILAIGQFVNIACGSVAQLLNMAGYERLTRNVNLSTNIGCVVLIFILAPTVGVIGIALAVAANLIIKNMINTYLAWRRMRIWTLPFPLPKRNLLVTQNKIRTEEH